MRQWITHWASALGLGTSLCVGLVLLVSGCGFWTLVLRAAVAGGIVFLFAEIGGQLLGQSLLRSLAEAELLREAEEAQRAAMPAAPGEASDLDASPEDVEEMPSAA